MDPKIKRIIEICRFEEDPSWKIMSKLFDGVTFDDYPKILENREAVIQELIEKAEAEKITYPTQELEGCVLGVDGKKAVTLKPLLITGGLYLPEQNVRISNIPVYLGKNVILTDMAIHAPSYIADGARIEYSNIQSDNRSCFVGENTVVSNVQEMRGCFVSGGPLREDGRKQIYLHCRSINNMIVGAYTGMSVGVDVFNHPLGTDPSVVVDPETLEPKEFPKTEKNRKLPILIGLEAVLGAGALINSGSIIGAKAVVPNRSEVDGLVFIDEKGEQKGGIVFIGGDGEPTDGSDEKEEQIYIRAREEKKL